MMEFFCMQCMRRRPQQEVYCPACGYKHDNKQMLPHALAPEWILDGRYLIGNVQNQDQKHIYYTARDLRDEKVIRIMELFPKDMVIRDGELVIWSVPQAAAQKRMEEYLAQNSGKKMFLDNGTIYCVDRAPVPVTEERETEETEPAGNDLVEIPDDLVHIPTSFSNVVVETLSEPNHKSGEKATKTKFGDNRKFPKFIITVICILTLILGWCGIQHLRGDQAMENREYDTAIFAYGMDFLFGSKKHTEAIRMAGEAAYDRKEYASAADYFESLGEAGSDRWSDSIYALGEQLIDSEKYDEAISALERISSEKRAEEQIGVAMLKKAESLYRGGKSDEAIKLAKSIKNTDKADVVSFLNNVYFNMAEIFITEQNYQGAINAYRQCKDMPVASFHLDVLEQIQNGNPYQAATEVISHLDDGSTAFSRNVWLNVFNGMLEMDSVPAKIEEHLPKKAAIALLAQPIDFHSEEHQKKISQKLEKKYGFGDSRMQDSSMIGQYKLEADSYYRIDSLENFYKRCGTDPAGKILIIVQSVNFPDKEKRQSVSFGLTELLPAEYQPASLAEVEYVVLIKYDYVRTGTYTGGSASLRENVRVYAYRMPDQRQVAVSGSTYAEDASNTVYYVGTMPAWFSGGMPNAAKELIAVLKKIM